MEMEFSRNNIDVECALDGVEASTSGGDCSTPSVNQSNEKGKDLIEWDGPHDPGNPHNWPKWKKGLCTISMGSLNFCVTFSSSVMTTATKPLAEKYGVSEVVATLATSLFVLGFAIGPIIWGPLSEHSGRKVPTLEELPYTPSRLIYSKLTEKDCFPVELINRFGTVDF